MSAPSFVRTPARPAEWKKIPDGMRALWKACLPDQDGGDVARSLAINFVGVAAAAEQDELQQVLDRLQRRTPCRAFVLLIDEQAKVGAAELTAATRCHGSVRDIVLEQITIRLPESAFAQIPGLVRPLLMNDLPNHLYWATRWPRNAAMFDALAGLCDHAVVDSRRFADPARDLRAVQERRARGLRVTDLTWLRLRPWRRAIAEAFERVPWTAGTPTTATVHHGRAAVASAQRLADWVGERLAAKVELAASDDGTAACPDSVVVRTGGFEVELEAVSPHVRIHVTTPEHCWLPFSVPMSRGTDGDLLGAAIDIG